MWTEFYTRCDGDGSNGLAGCGMKQAPGPAWSGCLYRMLGTPRVNDDILCAFVLGSALAIIIFIHWCTVQLQVKRLLNTKRTC